MLYTFEAWRWIHAKAITSADIRLYNLKTDRKQTLFEGKTLQKHWGSICLDWLERTNSQNATIFNYRTAIVCVLKKAEARCFKTLRTKTVL